MPCFQGSCECAGAVNQYASRSYQFRLFLHEMELYLCQKVKVLLLHSPVPPNNSIRPITLLSVLYSRIKLDAPRGDLSTIIHEGEEGLETEEAETV